MFKRTKGYFLLTMLVLTGLAGRIHSDTLSGKERRQLIAALKQSKAELSASLSGLSEKQLLYKPSAKEPSIRELIHSVAHAEAFLWQTAKSALETPASALKARPMPDAVVATQVSVLLPASVAGRTGSASAEEALKAFETTRTEVIRYVRTTTENVRNHLVNTPAGTMDAYQLMLTNALYTRHCLSEIEKRRSEPDFPR
ncbi:MAG TPA: DinB family protein [Flavisolibacter sp.]|nr:DinB family protein [Flavisolibacter sp.]